MATPEHDVARAIRDRYLARTPRSRQLHEEAMHWLPGGDTRTINHFAPYPTFMARGTGCTLIDVDGNEYLDAYNNMSATVHGHGHPALAAVAIEQFGRGSALGTPAEVQVRHAEALSRRVTSMQRIRYCNSGTEATMMAVRAARGVTGKDAIAKIDGGYHGLHDHVQVNMFMGMPEPRRSQHGLPETFPLAQVPRGVPADAARNVYVIPYNDLPAAEQLLVLHGERIAALIVEPMLGAAGCIPGQVEYLRGLRRLTAAHDVLLIFDECATFRLGPLQSRYGISPDLTSLSKIIGGGLPLGAFGGREDVMAQFDPARPAPLYHAGAMAGNNLSLAVGLAALETYGADEVVRLNRLGERLIREIPEAAAGVGVQLDVTGIGSLLHLHWGSGPIADAHDAYARRSDVADFPALLHLELLNRGVYISQRGMLALSIPTTEGHIDRLVSTLRDALAELEPYIAERLSRLLIHQPVAQG